MAQPFGEPLDDRSRELYGRYVARWSSLKIARSAVTNIVAANGTNWVDLTWALASFPLLLHDHDKAVYQYAATKGGAWAGIPEFRMLVDDKKVYPFPSEDDLDTTGNNVHLGSLSTNVRMGEVFKVQFRSTNAGDGAGKTILMSINYATFE